MQRTDISPHWMRGRPEKCCDVTPYTNIGQREVKVSSVRNQQKRHVKPQKSQVGTRLKIVSRPRTSSMVGGDGQGGGHATLT